MEPRILAETGPQAKSGDPARITEMDALVAYLQMLGTLVDVEKAAPQEQGAAPAAQPEKAP